MSSKWKWQPAAQCQVRRSEKEANFPRKSHCGNSFSLVTSWGTMLSCLQTTYMAASQGIQTGKPLADVQSEHRSGVKKRMVGVERQWQHGRSCRSGCRSECFANWWSTAIFTLVQPFPGFTVTGPNRENIQWGSCAIENALLMLKMDRLGRDHKQPWSCSRATFGGMLPRTRRMFRIKCL